MLQLVLIIRAWTIFFMPTLHYISETYEGYRERRAIGECNKRLLEKIKTLLIL